jgi:hypothetical protein
LTTLFSVSSVFFIRPITFLLVSLKTVSVFFVTLTMFFVVRGGDVLRDNIGTSKNNSIKKNSGNTIKNRIAKVYKLIRAITELTLKIQAKGVTSTGNDQSKVIQDLEGIKLHAEEALRNTSPPLTTQNSFL